MKDPELHTVTVANLKGGVGKTTTAVCLASGLALKGRRTVLVDMDSHCSATAHLLDSRNLDEEGTIFDVLDGKKGFMEAAIPTHIETLSIVSPGVNRDPYERYGGRTQRDELVLKKTIEKLKNARLDYVIIDTPPSIDFFTVNAIAASDWILVPVTCEYLPLLGLKKFNQVLAAAGKRLKVRPRILGYLLTMVDRRERITWEVEEILKKTFGSLLFHTHIRIDTRIKSCPSHRKTVYEFEPEDGRARSDYAGLVDEVIERIESPIEMGIM